MCFGKQVEIVWQGRVCMEYITISVLGYATNKCTYFGTTSAKLNIKKIELNIMLVF